jgi:hypothetical protein
MWESRRDFQEEWEGWEAVLWLSMLSTPSSLCAVHVRQFEGESPLSNLVEVKD